MDRPRVDRRPRRPAAARRPALSSLVWRNLALAAAVVILGGGTVVGVHLLGVGEAQRADSSPDTPTPSPTATQAGLVSATAPPAPEPARPAAPIAPTAADFARPAFLEPMAPVEQTTAPAAAETPAAAPDEGADPVEVASIPTPPAQRDVAPLPQKRPSDIPADGDDGAAGGRTARITMDINLRSGPRRASRVIATIPAGTKVTLIGCKSWCEVVANGKRGYVYRRAVDR